jgi:hypothetical protein
MPRTHRDHCKILVLGGDGRYSDLRVGASVLALPSALYGNGNTRRAIAIIAAGSVDLVVLFVRWLGHAEFWQIIAACTAANVRVLVITGGLSAARREVRTYLGSESDPTNDPDDQPK